jgi:hypothetical protein
MEKSTLGLDKGCEAFLLALAAIMKKLKLEIPAPMPAR